MRKKDLGLFQNLGASCRLIDMKVKSGRPEFNEPRLEGRELRLDGQPDDIGDGEVVGGGDRLDLLLLALFHSDNEWLAEFWLSFGKHSGDSD